MTGLPARDACDADILVLGGSFLGVELVRALRRRSRDRALRICVVDRLGRHDYVPLCHEILTARLTRDEAVLETAAYVRRHGGEYVADEIVGLDPVTHTVRTASGRTLRGRTIVVALGSTVTSPPTSASSAPVHLRGLKAASDLEALEGLLARLAGRPARIAVVGGGISGCELAGELAVLAGTRPGLEVLLVHRGARLLEGLHPRVSRAAQRRLEDQGVGVRLGASLAVAAEGRCHLEAQGQRTAEALDAVVWSAGVAPPAVVGALGLAMDPRGWLEVDTRLQCAHRDGTPAPGIFAGGDIVQIVDAGRPVHAMRRAIEAIVQASRIARNVLAVIDAPDPAAASTALAPYRPLRDFPHGVSLGARSLLVLGSFCFDLLGFTVWFRRFLMRQYFARYR